MIIYNYITTNLINGKQYIGMHTSDSVDDNYLGSGILMLKALKKYSHESFKREILNICATLKEANENEKLLIEKYNTLSPNGYNLSPTGGLGFRGCHSEEARKKMIGNKNAAGIIPSEATREKIRITKLGNDWGFKKGHKINIGKKLSEVTKKKMSEMRRGENNYFYGKTHSQESRDQMSKKRKGRDVFWSRGIKRTDETKRKISETKKLNPYKSTWLGKKHSLETRLKMSNSAKLRKNNRVA